MSVVDYIKQLSDSHGNTNEKAFREGFNALRDIEEVETTLREIGVNLEPDFFDVSLTARIGTRSPSQ
jgi:hypothetical protein